MGHEVAHALARHGAERMSQGMLAELGAAGLGAALGTASPAARQAVMAAFGVGTQVGVLLPFSRAQESEADHIGMILMARAGYDPEAALHLWERMESAAAAKEESSAPEFLSTHPGYGTRQANIRNWIAEARSYYVLDSAAGNALLPGVSAQ
jgi:predicted Zn-dependent protease